MAKLLWHPEVRVYAPFALRSIIGLMGIDTEPTLPPARRVEMDNVTITSSECHGEIFEQPPQRGTCEDDAVPAVLSPTLSPASALS